MIGKIKNNKIYLLSFFIPLIMMVFLSVIFGTFLFGDKTFATADAYTQYVPFCSYFWKNLCSFDFDLYSFRAGMGADLIPMLSYYAMSPVNIIYGIFKGVNPFKIYDFILILRIAFTSFFATWVISKKYKSKDNMIVCFGLMYTFSGFVIAYYWNCIWLDAVMVFPLIYYYLTEYLADIKNKKNAVKYSLLLFFIFMANFYIAYEVSVFIIIIFFMSKFTNFKDFVSKAMKVFFYSITAILGNAFCLFYTIKVLLSYSTSVDYSYYNFHFWDIPKSFLAFQLSLIGDSSSYLYFSMIGFLLLVLFFVNKNIVKEHKIKAGVFVTCAVLFSCVQPLYYMIHGFDYPNFLYNRYTFILIFMFVFYAYESYLNLDKIKTKNIVITIITCGLFFVVDVTGLYFGWKNYKNIGEFSVFASISIFVIYFYFIYTKKYKYILYLLIFECFFGMFFSLKSLGVKDIPELKAEDSTYNVDYGLPNFWCLNDSSSPGLFSSTINKDLSLFISPLNRLSGNVSYGLVSGDLFTSSIFGINKVDSDYDIDSNYFEYDEDSKLYNFKDALSLGYVIENDLSNYELPKENLSPSIGLNKLFKSLTGLDADYCSDVNFDLSRGDDGETCYITFDADYDNVVLVAGKSVGNFALSEDGAEYSYCVYIDHVNKGDVVYYYPVLYDEADAYAYSYDSEVFDAGYNVLSKNQVIVDSFEDSSVTGHITCDKDSSVLFRLGYNKNISAYIDGEKVDIVPVCDALIQLNVPEGSHNIEIKYELPQTYKYMIIVNIIWLCLYFGTVIYILTKKEK